MQLGMESDPFLHDTIRHITHFTIFRNHMLTHISLESFFMDGTSANRVDIDRTLQNAASVRFCKDG